MGLFGSGDDAPAKPPDTADALNHAVSNDDAITAFRLLESAGDACQVRKLAETAKDRSILVDGKAKYVTFSIGGDAEKERLTMQRHTYHSTIDVAYVENAKCKD